MRRPEYEVADIIRGHGSAFEQQYNPPVQVKKTLRALTLCRTEALGGHVTKCSNCGKETISYNSCRNRHCPKCQVVNREKWIMARESELLPVAYYHLVFTLPNAFNELLPKHGKEVYSSLFAASWQTIQAFAGDHKYLGAKTGMVSILHIPLYGTGSGGNNSGCILMCIALFPVVVLLHPVNGNLPNTRTSICFPKGH